MNSDRLEDERKLSKKLSHDSIVLSTGEHLLKASSDEWHRVAMFRFRPRQGYGCERSPAGPRKHADWTCGVWGALAIAGTSTVLTNGGASASGITLPPWQSSRT
jgi:hypothetical protein